MPFGSIGGDRVDSRGGRPKALGQHRVSRAALSQSIELPFAESKTA
jgi:hypothetical protein